jgi:cytochrome c553
MKHFAAALTVTALLIGPGQAQNQRPPSTGVPPQAAQQPAPASMPGSVQRGHDIVEQGTASGALPCSQCHGMNGAGNGTDAFPRLDGQSAYYLYKQLTDYASGARQNEIMSMIAQGLSDAERQDVAAYYGSQAFTDTLPQQQPPQQADAQALQIGRTIVNVGMPERGVQNCSNCHGPNALGLDPAAPRLAGQWASYARAQFQAFRDGTRKNDIAAVMRDISHRITDPEIEAVSAYLEASRPPRLR